MFRKHIVALIVCCIYGYSFSQSIRWNIENESSLPAEHCFVLLLADVPGLGNGLRINHGTYDFQFTSNGGNIGTYGGAINNIGAGIEAKKFGTEFYVQIFKFDPLFVTAAFNLPYVNPNEDYPEISELLIAESSRISYESLEDGGYIGGGNSQPTFLFDQYIYAVPEPSGVILILFGLGILCLNRSKN